MPRQEATDGRESTASGGTRPCSPFSVTFWLCPFRAGCPFARLRLIDVVKAVNIVIITIAIVIVNIIISSTRSSSSGNSTIDSSSRSCCSGSSSKGM